MVIIKKVLSMKYLMTPRSAILGRIKENINKSKGIMPLNVYAKSDPKPCSNEDLNGYN